MSRFKSKPVEIDAIILDGKTTVETSIGTQVGNKGDFLITYSDGHQAIIPHASFVALYDPLDEEASLLFLLGGSNQDA